MTMLVIFTWFFLVGGVFQIGSALVLHLGVRVPAFMQGRTALGQLCQGAAGLFLAQACSTVEGQATVVTWVAACLAPVLLYFGLRADQHFRQARRVRSA